MPKHVHHAAAACALVALTLGAGAPAYAEVDFAGKQLTSVVSSRAGGGTDRVARIVGPMLAKALPGNPDIIFRNMPAGSGTAALNYLVEKAPADGTLIMWGAGSPIWPDHLRRSSVRYNPGDFRMVGSLPSPSGLMVVRKEAMDRLNDKSKPPVIMGDVTGNSSVAQMLVWGPNFLDWNVKFVVGFNGRGAMKLAFERGETQIFADYNAVVLNRYKEEGCCVFHVQRGIPKGDDMVPSPDWPDVPVFADLIVPKLPDQKARDAFDAWLAISEVGKWYGLPPKASDAVVKAHRDAWAEVSASQEFDKQIKKAYSPVYTVQNGPEFEKTVKRLIKVSDDSLKYIDELRANVGIPVGGKLLKK